MLSKGICDQCLKKKNIPRISHVEWYLDKELSCAELGLRLGIESLVPKECPFHLEQTIEGKRFKERLKRGIAYVARPALWTFACIAIIIIIFGFVRIVTEDEVTMRPYREDKVTKYYREEFRPKLARTDSVVSRGKISQLENEVEKLKKVIQEMKDGTTGN